MADQSLHSGGIVCSYAVGSVESEPVAYNGNSGFMAAFYDLFRFAGEIEKIGDDHCSVKQVQIREIHDVELAVTVAVGLTVTCVAHKKIYIDIERL